jgi:hypothetical protein
MSNLVLALVSVMVILAAMMGLVTGFTGPQAQIGETVKRASGLYGEISRTELSSVNVSVISAGATVDWTVSNSGQTQLRRFEDWDLVIIYQDSAGSGLQPQYLTYTTNGSPSAGEWTVTGIYRDASTLTAEVFNPGIIDPGEEFIVRAQLSPSISTPTTNTVTLAVENGVTVSAQFTN